MSQFKTTTKNGSLIVDSNNGEVIFTIPKDGTDLARVTIEITRAGKYTANDIYVLRNKMMREVLGVEATHEEIEEKDKPTSNAHKEINKI